MPFHTSGSMSRSFGGGYGTIKIFLEETAGLTQGEEYSYRVANGQTIHTAIAARINGHVVLVDSNYTIGSNPPPFFVGQSLTVLVPDAGSGMGDIPLLTTVINSITPLNEPPPGAESEPTSPPAGITLQNPMIGALSPQGQWTWSGARWDNIPGPPLEEKIVTLFDGANLRTFQLREEIPIEEFMSTVLKDVPIEAIQELDSNNEVVETYEVEHQTSDTTFTGIVGRKSQNRKAKRRSKFNIKKTKGKRVVPDNTRSVTDVNTNRSIQQPGGDQQSRGGGGRSATTQIPGGGRSGGGGGTY
tara:strand:- start:3628 stop:4530 length:903 start_codon:yes stop_codon:yes gene_type:complete